MTYDRNTREKKLQTKKYHDINVKSRQKVRDGRYKSLWEGRGRAHLSWCLKEYKTQSSLDCIMSALRGTIWSNIFNNLPLEQIYKVRSLHQKVQRLCWSSLWDRVIQLIFSCMHTKNRLFSSMLFTYYYILVCYERYKQWNVNFLVPIESFKNMGILTFKTLKNGYLQHVHMLLD